MTTTIWSKRGSGALAANSFPGARPCACAAGIRACVRLAANTSSKLRTISHAKRRCTAVRAKYHFPITQKSFLYSVGMGLASIRFPRMLHLSLIELPGQDGGKPHPYCRGTTKIQGCLLD